MKCLLKVGYTTFLLPTDSGIQTAIKLLSQAAQCNDYTFRSRDPHISVDPDPLEVSIKYLPAKTKIVFKTDHSDLPPEPLALNAPGSIILTPPTH